MKVVTDLDENTRRIQILESLGLTEDSGIYDYQKVIVDLFDLNKQIDIVEMGKQIEELRKQIEKMKCCQNCKNYRRTERFRDCCLFIHECKNYDKWESAE
jgi:hypothetical protein